MTGPDTPPPAVSDPIASVEADDLAELTALVRGQLASEPARQLRARLARDRQLLAAFGALRARHQGTSIDNGTPADGSALTPAGDDLRQRLTPGRVGLVAAAAVVTAAAMVWLASAPVRVPPHADTTRPLSTSATALGSLWPVLAAGPTDLGYLTEQNRLQTCWPSGVPPVLGARPVIIDGRYGVLVATPDPDQPALIKLMVLGRDCDDLDGGIIAETRVPSA